MVFTYRRPIVVIHPGRDKSGIRFEGEKMILQQGGEELQVKPSQIERWKAQLSAF
jgi:hypothetical protein